MPLTGKTFPGYKRNGLDPAICFYKVEDGDNQTFYRVPPRTWMSQRTQPIPSFNLNLIITIPPTTLSYTSI